VRGYARAGRSRIKTDNVAEMVSASAQYLILAQNGLYDFDPFKQLDKHLKGPGTVVITKAPPPQQFSSITDDRAFATGVLVANLGLQPIIMGLLFIALVLLLVGGILWWFLRRKRDPDNPGTKTRGFSVAALAAGFNFIAIEYLMVYRWLDRLDIPLDATFVGMVTFAALAALGSILLAKQSSRIVLGLCAFFALALVVSGFLFPAAGLLLVALAAVLTGTLFPRILGGDEQRLTRVYVWDAYGALWGGLVALFVPIFTGFSGYQAITGITLVLAAWAVHRVTRSGG